MNGDMILGYGAVVALLIVIGVVLERTAKRSTTISDYATAGRSFGSWFSAMAFVNTWLPGTIFITFAGLAAASGAIGYYVVLYSLLAVVLMFLLAKPVSVWGHAFDLRTQADLMGVRYNSRAVRIVAAAIGFLASFPWLVLGMQSLGLVFEYLSFGAIQGAGALAIGLVIIVIRQFWTVRFGARGVVISDMVQGIVAYGFGGLLLLGLLSWLFLNGHSLADTPEGFFALPGPGSEVGPLYFFSLVLAGALGGWCWPDIFVRLFTSKSEQTIKRAAVKAAPILFLFGTVLILFAIAASTYPGVAEATDHVLFITAGVGGAVTVTIAGLAVLCATFGNVGANLQALGTMAANDIVPRSREAGQRSPRVAQVVVAVLTLVSAALTLLIIDAPSGMIVIGMAAYEGIVQLAPALFLGIFWRRGTAGGALAGMLVGVTSALIFYALYPLSVPWLGGLVPGVAALLLNTLAYVVVSLVVPHGAAERERVNALFERVRRGDTRPETGETALPAGETEGARA